MSEEEHASQGVIKFLAIVVLDGLDGGTKLCACLSQKIGQSINHLRFRQSEKVKYIGCSHQE